MKNLEFTERLEKAMAMANGFKEVYDQQDIKMLRFFTITFTKEGEQDIILELKEVNGERGLVRYCGEDIKLIPIKEDDQLTFIPDICQYMKNEGFDYKIKFLGE